MDRRNGTALLSVLLIVAVMAAIAATALDRLSLATRLAGNAGVASQGRQWLGMAEELARARILEAAQLSGAQQAGLFGVERAIDLPDGQTVTARLEDASNCFNLNALVRKRRDGSLDSEARRVFQFRDMMELLGVPPGNAQQIADSAADAIDSDSLNRPLGRERHPDGSPVPNRPFASPGELAEVEGMTPEIWEQVRPFVCTLPSHDPVTLNIETLRPDQAVLLAMLDKDAISLPAARAQIEGRPADGFGSVVDFWNDGPLSQLDVQRRVQQQVAVETRFFRLVSRVGADETELSQEALFSVDGERVLLHGRRWNLPE